MKYEFGKLSKMLVIATALYLANYLFEQFEVLYFENLRIVCRMVYPWLYLAVIGVLKLPLMLAFVALMHWLGMIESDDKQRFKDFLLKTKKRVAPGTGD